MKIICIGDSLTEGDYGIYGKRGIANVQAENYPYFLSKYLGANTVNKGKCGYTSTRYLQFYNDKNVDVHEADIIIIILGTNGGLDPDNDTQGNEDYLKLIELCIADAPTAKIVLCTPPHVTVNPQMAGYGCKDKVMKAQKFVKMTALKTDLALIDFAECDAFTSENEAIMQPNDGVHFGCDGYRTMAEFIGDNLKKFYPEMF